jgi:predicted neutral ceramidase superfamily lipid hydrolase
MKFKGNSKAIGGAIAGLVFMGVGGLSPKIRNIVPFFAAIMGLMLSRHSYKNNRKYESKLLLVLSGFMIIISLAYIEHIFIGTSYGVIIYLILVLVSVLVLSVYVMIKAYKNRQVSKLLGGAYLFTVSVVAVICLITK